MPTAFYPIFREYNLAIQKWLRGLIDIPNLAKYDFAIDEITLKGDTVVVTAYNDGNVTTTSGIDQHEVHLSTSDHGLKSNYMIKLYDTTSIQVGDRILNNDDQYLIEAVKDNIIIIDKSYKKLRLGQTAAGGRLRRVVNVIYGEMQEAIARIASPLRNGVVTTPGVAFYLSDQQVKEGTRPKENYYTRRYYDTEGNKIGSVAVPPLQEYTLTYSINIWSPYRSYMSMLQYQIQSEFAPEKFFWIPGFGQNDTDFGFEYTEGTSNCRQDREHHGQWAHAVLEGIADASDLEPGANAQTVYRTEITFQLTNAFMALPFEREQSYIGEVSLEQHIEDRLDRI